MSAHRIYCYAPQRDVAVNFLESVGAVISRDTPHAVHSYEQLMGLEHITFITVDNHQCPIPQPMWEVITRQGAMVIHVDDQYKRSRAARRVAVTHYEGAQREASAPTAD